MGVSPGSHHVIGYNFQFIRYIEGEKKDTQEIDEHTSQGSSWFIQKLFGKKRFRFSICQFYYYV
jgi:hypothetical protein